MSTALDEIVRAHAPSIDDVVHQLHAECAPLMAELGSKNHVRVFLHRHDAKGRRYNWAPAELLHDSRVDDGQLLALLPQLGWMDSLRMMAGKQPLYLDKAIQLTGGELRSVTPNLRTTVGIDYCAKQLGGSASTSVATYIALSNNTDSPVVGDTSTNTTAGAGINWGTNSSSDGAASNARGELTYGGMTRALATYAHTGGTANYTMTKTFTASGAVTAVQACGLLDSASQGAGTLFVENTFTATTLATGDQLTIAWTLNI